MLPLGSEIIFSDFHNLHILTSNWKLSKHIHYYSYDIRISIEKKNVVETAERR